MHATGPLVSYMDFWASPSQYIRDKDRSFSTIFMANISGDSKSTHNAIDDLFELMLHVLYLFNFIDCAVFDYLSICEEGSVPD